MGKIFAIILLCVFGFVLDWIVGLLTGIGIPFWIANLIPVMIFGSLLESASSRSGERHGFVKFLRIVIFGALVSFVLLRPMAWILRPVLLLVIGFIAIVT